MATLTVLGTHGFEHSRFWALTVLAASRFFKHSRFWRHSRFWAFTVLAAFTLFEHSQSEWTKRWLDIIAYWPRSRLGVPRVQVGKLHNEIARITVTNLVVSHYCDPIHSQLHYQSKEKKSLFFFSFFFFTGFKFAGLLLYSGV